MKKLIAISVIFAIVAGAAFAEINLGGEVFGSVGVFGGGGEDLDATTDYAINRARLSGSGQNDAGTIGGNLRFDASSIPGFDVGSYAEAYNAWADEWDEWDQGGRIGDEPEEPNEEDFALNSMLAEVFGWVWWKPIEQIRIQIGSNGGDGEFGLEGLTGWGFEGLAYEFGGKFGNAPWGSNVNGWKYNRRSVFYSGWNAPGMWLQVAPIPEFVINVGLPGDGLAKDIFKSAHLQATYSLDGVGLFGVTYVGQGADVDGKVYLFADLAIVDGLGLNVGFSYDLEAKDIGFGVGATYDITEEFGIKGVVTAIIPDEDCDYMLLVDLLPYYKINDTMTGFCSIAVATWDGDDSISWMVNPYLKISTGWCQDVYAGLKLQSCNDADADWSFTLAMTIGF